MLGVSLSSHLKVAVTTVSPFSWAPSLSMTYIGIQLTSPFSCTSTHLSLYPDPETSECIQNTPRGLCLLGRAHNLVQRCFSCLTFCISSGHPHYLYTILDQAKQLWDCTSSQLWTQIEASALDHSPSLILCLTWPPKGRWLISATSAYILPTTLFYHQ